MTHGGEILEQHGRSMNTKSITYITSWRHSIGQRFRLGRVVAKRADIGKYALEASKYADAFGDFSLHNPDRSIG